VQIPPRVSGEQAKALIVNRKLERRDVNAVIAAVKDGPVFPCLRALRQGREASAGQEGQRFVSRTGRGARVKPWSDKRPFFGGMFPDGDRFTIARKLVCVQTGR